MVKGNANGVPLLTYYIFILSGIDTCVLCVTDSAKSIGPFFLLHGVLLKKPMLFKPDFFHRCFCSAQES